MMVVVRSLTRPCIILGVSTGRTTDGVGGVGGGHGNGYDDAGMAGEQPEGLVLVWSLGLPSRYAGMDKTWVDVWMALAAIYT